MQDGGRDEAEDACGVLARGDPTRRAGAGEHPEAHPTGRTRHRKTQRPYLAVFLAPALLLALALAGCAKQSSTTVSAPPPGGPGGAPPRAASQPRPAPAQAPGGPRGALARPVLTGYGAVPGLADSPCDCDQYDIQRD